MIEKEYYEELRKALCISFADAADKLFIQGMNNLSPRKKKKIKKWVLKAIGKVKKGTD